MSGVKVGLTINGRFDGNIVAIIAHLCAVWEGRLRFSHVSGAWVIGGLKRRVTLWQLWMEQFAGQGVREGYGRAA